MSWWEWLNTAVGAASLGSLILGAILGAVSWRLNRSTERLIERTTANTQGILARMNELAEERHREVISAIQGPRG
jgi:hypothetical protein